MKRSLDKLELLSNTISTHQTYYTFNKMEDDLSAKYKKGRVSASKWLNELIYYYMKKESSFIEDFKHNIIDQKKFLSILEDNDYKKGLIDELNLIEEMLNDRNN